MTKTSIRRLVGGLAALAVLPIAALELGLLILRPEGGPFGVLQVVAPHLALLGLALGLIAVVLRSRTGTVATVALAVLTAVRFGGEWISLPVTAATGGAAPLSLATWNLELAARPPEATVAMLREVSADVVALQELTPATAAAIQADPVLAARYPAMALRPRMDVLGMGVLSSLPITSSRVDVEPAVQTARLGVGGGELTILNVHPMHADIAVVRRRVPIGIDVDRRNADLEAIRRRLDDVHAGGDPVIVLGDFNTASSEPAFDRLVSGLRDVHAEVGQGTGWTWRPIRLEFLGIGLIRIDHVLVTPDIRPVAIEERCPEIGDHCLVHAEVAVP